MGLSRPPGTCEASEGQQVEITRFRCEGRRRQPFLRADRRIEAWLGIATVSLAAVDGLRQNEQKRDCGHMVERSHTHTYDPHWPFMATSGVEHASDLDSNRFRFDDQRSDYRGDAEPKNRPW